MFAIRAAHAFDGESFVVGGATLIIDGSTIVGVEPASYDLPADCPMVDHGDATVLPGLIDAHVHLVADSGPLALERVAGFSDGEIDAVVTEALRRQLAAGVTTIRDLGDRRFNVVDRRDAQRAQDDGLPWIVASGPPITSPGGHCCYLGGEVAGPDEIAEAVRERVERRVDIVKVMASGGMTTPGTDVSAPQFSLDDLRLLVDAVHGAGLPIAAHAHAASAIDQAILVGVEVIEHGSYLTANSAAGLAGLGTPEASDAQLESLAASGALVCPTMGGLTPELFRCAPPQVQQMILDSGMTPEEIVGNRRTFLERMHRFGVRFVSGMDAGISPGKAHGAYAGAVTALASATGAEGALLAATSRAAESCGLGASKGRLARGYDADVLIVGGDLAADINVVSDVRQVVLRGIVV